MGWSTVVWNDDGLLVSKMVVEWNTQLMCESIDYSSSNAKTSERSWSFHKGDFCNVFKIFFICIEFVMNPCEKLFG